MNMVRGRSELISVSWKWSGLEVDKIRAKRNDATRTEIGRETEIETTEWTPQ